MMPGCTDRIVATVEARMASSRLSGKVLMDVCDQEALLHLVSRLKRSQFIDEVVIATTVNPLDDAIESFALEKGLSVFRGSEEDVLSRVLQAGYHAHADILVEITGDCPAIDWRVVDHLIAFFYSQKVDYVSNMGEKPYPVGFEAQVFPLSVLEAASERTHNPADREHVSLYIYTHPDQFSLAYLEADDAWHHPEIEVTLDTQEDLALIRAVFEALYPSNPDFSGLDVIQFLKSHPDLMRLCHSQDRKYAQDFLDERNRYASKN